MELAPHELSAFLGFLFLRIVAGLAVPSASAILAASDNASFSALSALGLLVYLYVLAPCRLVDAVEGAFSVGCKMRPKWLDALNASGRITCVAPQIYGETAKMRRGA